MKKYLLLILLLIPLKVYATDAKEVTKESSFYIADQSYTKFNDGNVKSNVKINQGLNLVIHNDTDQIKQLYIVYEISSKHGKLITSSGETVNLGENEFLHEYVSLDKPDNDITLTFDEDVTISEIRLFTDGDTPKDVQKWTRETSTDLMIFSTHADDEQLFFAGVMPTYINQNKKVHVVYFARHDVGAYYAPNRLHEQLDGLWTLGVTDYPTFGIIPDAYSESIDVARSQMNSAGFKDEDVINFYVMVLRSYKPKVILGHDENGEYGHGQHRLNIYLLKEAYDEAANPEYNGASSNPYKVPKFYIHLYDMDNKTVLDYDSPLDKYDGKTAYEVSKEGYSKHLSQQYTWFTNWLNGNNNSYTSATQITKYNPAYWGLYKSEVGPDINKNDLFENIVEEKIEEPTNTDQETKNTTNKKSKKTDFYELYNKYKFKLIIINGLVIIIGIILIVIINKKRRTRK